MSPRFPDAFRYRVLMLCGLLLAVAGCGEKEAANEPLAAAEAAVAASLPASAPAAATAPAAIEVKPLGQVAILLEREAPAQVISANESKLAAEISARVVALPVDAGQTVARGALVAKLDDADAKLELQRAEAALEQSRARAQLAQDQMDRARALQEKNFVSPEGLKQRETEYKVAEADVRAAQAQVNAARRGLEKTSVFAPFDAIVKTRHAQQGELASPGSPLITLLDRSRLEVSAQIQTHDVDDAGKAGQWRFVAGDQEAALKLLRISPAVDRAARSIEARFSFVGKPLAPGLEGKLVWRDKTLHVPANLLAKRGAALGVFLMAHDKAVFHALPEAQEGRPAAITLAPDVPVIVTGWQPLQDGQSVAPVGR